MTKLRAVLASVVLALLTTFLVALPASADDSAPITRYDVVVNLTPEGVAEVAVDFTMDFSAVRGRGPIVLLPTRQTDGADPDWDYVFDYSDVRVSSPSGASANVNRDYESGMMALRIGDENRWNTTPQDYTLTYSVTGFIVSDHPKSGLDEFNWDVIGPAWRSEISNLTVTVTGPTAVSGVACFYGPYSAQERCDASSSGDTATFAHAETLPRGIPSRSSRASPRHVRRRSAAPREGQDPRQCVRAQPGDRRRRWRGTRRRRRRSRGHSPTTRP
ncbi:MAG: DUF2207 domain-containing protein [Tessaracoccus sp.]|uniref:DUF2207 domain-containing protein n=1 Tax=Tessaracoccus sp. TaxID=1971211 RepID=UPI001ED02E3B|nr:DUF2207 domain-containing protein [Tessaracoccus sp.]MBK7821657.1 DUF2207 domain-containing protein [Tessaracoccus sp.]